MVALQIVAEQHLQTRFGRNVFPRKAAPTPIRGRRLDHTVPARRQPAIDMTLVDLSTDGLAATTEQLLMWGERLVVQLPARNGLLAWTAMGRVARCEANSIGYDVSIEFERLPAA